MVMAVVTPQTDVYLLKCPLEIDQQNQLTFANATAQYNYFIGLSHTPAIADNDFTYQRKDGIMRYPAHIDDIRSYNYCMYRNDAYSNKWFFAFIESMSYANDQTTFITLKTDVWQTWQFDFVFKSSFVQREHTNNDGVGSNILDEGLNVGKYIVNGFLEFKYQSNPQDCWVVALTTELLEGRYSGAKPSPRMIGGVPQGCYAVILDPSGNNIGNFVNAYDLNAKANAIVSMYILPKAFYPEIAFRSVEGQTGSGQTWGFDYAIMTPSTEAMSLGTYYCDRNTTLHGYTPKNNKLFTYPYNYLLITNNNGDEKEFYWEDLGSSQAQFTMKGVPSLGCNIRLIPTNYKNTTTGGYEWSLEAGSLPIVSWNSDYYLNWEASQGVKAGMNAASGYVSDYGKAGEAVASGAEQVNPGNILEGISRTLSSFGAVFKGLFSEVSSGYSESLKPNENRGQSTGDLNYAIGKTCFTGYKMSIKYEQAVVIDNYFSMYGYRTDKLKIPNITGRQNWNFVKTQICNILGDVPQADVEEMKDIMNAGITFWHNPSTYLDYSQNNAIL